MKFGFLFKTIDWFLVIVPIILLSFGVIIVYSLSGSGSAIAMNQAIYCIIGLILALIFTFIDYRTWKSISWGLYFFGVLGLALVPLIGTTIFGARRWIDLGFIQYQPSEVMKLLIIIALARLLSQIKTITLKELAIITIVIALPFGLVLKEPDLGSASVILFVSMILILLAKLPRKLIMGGAIIILICIPIAYKLIAPYQRARITTFLNPSADPTGSGYNVLQSKIAIGSGGLLGRGIGEGSQSQLNFLPVAHTDFIFAGAAEATGFIGSIALLGLIGLVIVRAIMIARLSQDLFGMYLSIGIASLFLYQTFINAGGNLGLVPVTGIPFPFVSSGGTSVIVAMVGVGILQSIYIRYKRIRFD
jgi:rod shape determining protein RodA